MIDEKHYGTWSEACKNLIGSSLYATMLHCSYSVRLYVIHSHSFMYKFHIRLQTNPFQKSYNSCVKDKDIGYLLDDFYYKKN